MTVFVSVGIIILAMLIMASMQLTPGTFLLFYHSALGKYSKSKVSFLTLYFFLGVETISAFLFLSCYMLTNACFLFTSCPEKSVLAWILVGILFALTFLFFFLYYRNNKTTELFISRRLASCLQQKAAKAKTRSDAFALGATSSICELVFTFPLYIITSIEIMGLGNNFVVADFLTLLYVFTPIIPVTIIYTRFRTGHNLVDIQKRRIKNINFAKFLVCLTYITIAILIICFRINTL